ncbi:MAG: hypothetical protein SO014_09860 [Candidatus Limivicinus sp.]|nr:hypothetical protein [Candidatus Limivicinus sp.]
MRRIAHHDHGQKPERMKFLRIIFGCPKGAGKWRVLFFAMLLHSKKNIPPGGLCGSGIIDILANEKMPRLAGTIPGHTRQNTTKWRAELL